MLALVGCGRSGPSSSTTSSTANNTQAVEVNLGPANNNVNGIFTDVTIYVPKSATCQTIPNVLVDTGSEGLRLLSSEVTLALPGVTDTNNDELRECVVYGYGSYNWGPVVTADIQLAGEKASSVFVQLIDSSNPTKYPVPNLCTSGGGPDENTVATLGTNGILGVGNFQQDCGGACTSASTDLPPVHWLCPSSVCEVTTVLLADQQQNPVWMFPQDNNGLNAAFNNLGADSGTSPSTTTSISAYRSFAAAASSLELKISQDRMAWSDRIGPTKRLSPRQGFERQRPCCRRLL